MRSSWPSLFSPMRSRSRRNGLGICTEYYLALKTAGESQNRSTRGRMPLLKLLCTDRQTDRQTVSATRRTLTWATRSRNSPSIFVCVCAVDVRTYDGSLAVVRPTRISRRASQSVSQGRKAV